MQIHNFPPDSVKAALAATRDDRDPLSVEARTVRLDQLEWLRRSAKEPVDGWGSPGWIALLTGHRGTGVGLLMARYAADAHGMGRRVIATDNVGLLCGQVVTFSRDVSGAAQMHQLARLAPANALFVISEGDLCIVNPAIPVSDEGYREMWVAVADAARRGAQWLIAPANVGAMGFGVPAQMVQAFSYLDYVVTVRRIVTQGRANRSSRFDRRWPPWACLNVLCSDWRNDTDPRDAAVNRYEPTKLEIFNAAHLLSVPAVSYLMAERRQELGEGSAPHMRQSNDPAETFHSPRR